jgi:S1-C subfamily serine protease
VASDSSLDIAVIKLVGDVPVLEVFDWKFASPDRVDYGDVAGVVGFPLDMGKLYTTGVIAHPDGTSDTGGDKFNDFYLACPAINPGNSGGPLFLFDKGEPVFSGISQFKYNGVDGVYGFVRIDEINGFLEREGYEGLIR